MHDDHSANGRLDDDPLERLERRDYSWRPALKYTGAVIGATVLTAIVIAVAGALSGGPNCDAGASRFICSRTWELAFPLVPGAVSLIGALGGFYQTYRHWKSFGNWRPWLAMCWALMPWTLLWMTSTFSIAILGVQ